MNFTLIICTYNRPEALANLLQSVEGQSRYPAQIIIVDGSEGIETKSLLEENEFKNLEYYKVDKHWRGLTKQRNFGIAKVRQEVAVVCFLDDDIILKPDYFERLIGTYSTHSDAIGVGGYIANEVKWSRKPKPAFDEYNYDGWTRKLGSRNVLRKRLGLLSKESPGIMPEFSNGLSIGFLPPTGETYSVEFFMGGVASYRKELLQNLKFSTFFKGYGLYEDLDFCLRASKIGNLYLNTGAQLYHHHEPGGRPNKFNYGKMVVRNGWYVWRVKYPKPGFKARVKWHSTVLLLTFIRLGNAVTTKNKKEALTEGLGRMLAWIGLFFKEPFKNREKG